MNPISGFSSATSQTCQPNCNGNNEKDNGEVSKKGCSLTNVPLSVSEQNACQVSHTARGPEQTLEMTLATARRGDRHLS